MAYTTHIYIIRTLTNLHVGSGESNYGVVDKEVQRDPATTFPTIHSSGLKGALREYMTNEGMSSTVIEHIFGSNPKADATKVKQGAYRFLNADILSLPQPNTSVNGTPYFNLTYKELLKQFAAKAKLLGVESKSLTAFEQTNAAQLKTLIGEELKQDEEKVFRGISEDLPVIARNHLESGVSQNLWYEEVVPKESYFAFYLQAPNADPEFNVFNRYVNNKIIQLGGNATVGYGLCHFKKI